MGIPGGFGVTLIAGLASAMLYGITTLTYVYYMHYSEDTSVIKFIVAAIWLLDSLHVSFMCHTLYYYLIINYGDPMSLLFFAHQIYHLCRNKMRWIVTVPIVLSVLAHLAFGMVTVIMTLVNNQASNVSRTRFYTATPAVSAIVLAEILITTSLCVLLYDSGSRSAVPRTKRLLNTLIIYAVNRCLLTLLVTVAELIVDANDQSAWTMGLDFIVGKLYANSLLASLNTRQHLRSQGSSPESNGHVNAVHFANLPKLSEEERSSKDVREGVVLDITTAPVHDKIPALRRGGEV
ncbi:hypothetical protein EDD15DRAFT_1455895 [Pisolithus albus]|nr:hypothetical protein EDD15DRAFT_1455895 [Pisolithus albus]